MLSRRDWLRLSLGSGAALALDPGLLRALQPRQVITRAIPSTGERIPIVGLGSSATFARVARSEDVGALVSVALPLALAWGALGVWLGRAQQRRVTDRPRPAAAVPEEAVAR